MNNKEPHVITKQEWKLMMDRLEAIGLFVGATLLVVLGTFILLLLK